MSEEVSFNFINDFQYKAFHCTVRHQCYSGGYGNGKTSVAMMKATALASKFSKYRIAILRRSSVDLKKTTMETFFKWCPPSLYDPRKGGARVDSRNYLRFINGSEIFWLHLDDDDSNVVRGLEINTAIVDQAEEISEEIYDHLNARVSRWDKAEIPKELNPDSFPKNKLGHPQVPGYMIICVNPDSFEHWVYKRYHEDSEIHNMDQEITPDPDKPEIVEHYKYSEDHIMLHGRSVDNPALADTNVRVMLQKDKAFVDRFVMGKWGIPEGQIHRILPESELEDIPISVLDLFLIRGSLYRIMDHGSSAPTCCIWAAVYEKWILIYKEYYRADARISEHREAIHELSRYAGFAEKYSANLADPDIFKKKSEKAGALYSVADEYTDVSGALTDIPPIHWEPADNNEFMTRNRIDELLLPRMNIAHPVTGEYPAPSLYFLKKSEAFPFGVVHALAQTKAQKREQLSVVNGKPIFSEERDKNIVDHAYDTVRYLVGGRPKHKSADKHKIIPNSFDEVKNRVNKQRVAKISMMGVLPESAIRGSRRA